MTATPVTPAPRSSARTGCGLAFALFLLSIMFGMYGAGTFSVLAMGGAILFAIIGGVCYVLRK